jgi:general secretion pathway protein D
MAQTTTAPPRRRHDPRRAGAAGRTARAQRANTAHISTTQGGGIMVNFKDANIDTVLDELSAVAGFIVVKEVKPEGKVTLVSKQPVTPADAISLLNTVLKNANYTAIQQGRILKIVTRDAAKRANIPVRVGSDPKDIEPTMS